jgi:acetyl-CoA decarbonylase/synthase complex subunit delta
MTQQPMICFAGEESWRQKESRAAEGVPTEWGDIEKRGTTWETVTATTLLESGADIVVLRHPKTIGVIRETINKLTAH